MLAALDVARTTALAIDDRMKGTLCALVGLTCVAWSIHSSYCPINASRCYAIDDESRERSKGWEIVGKKCVRDASEIKTCVRCETLMGRDAPFPSKIVLRVSLYCYVW
jgi:hypothetical protein